jgi:hypothetical protein
MDTGGSMGTGLTCEEGKKTALIRAGRGPTVKIIEHNEMKETGLKYNEGEGAVSPPLVTTYKTTWCQNPEDHKLHF